MSDEAERALAEHDAFETEGDAFAVSTTPFDATVTVRGTTYRVTVRAPSIDAAVEGEDVAPVVQEGWLETFERRMADASSATRTDADPIVDVDDDEIVVEVRIDATEPARGADDAKAVVDFVEGTYVLGVIPGYDYREPVAELLDRAEQRSKGEGPPPL